MIHPVIPGPVAKLYFKNPITPLYISLFLPIVCVYGNTFSWPLLVESGRQLEQDWRDEQSSEYGRLCERLKRIRLPMLPVLYRQLSFISSSHSRLEGILEDGRLTMEIDVPVEWDYRIKSCSSKERDEVPAYWEEDEDHVDYLYQRHSCLDASVGTYYEAPEPNL